MPRAARLSRLAAHPATDPRTAARIRRAVRRHRLASLAMHPMTSRATASRIRRALAR